MEDKFFFYVFEAFSITKMERKATYRHVLLRMVGEVEMSHDRVQFNLCEMFENKVSIHVTLVLLIIHMFLGDEPYHTHL